MCQTDYAAKSADLRAELERIKDLLDAHAVKMVLGVAGDDAALIHKVRASLEDVIQGYRELDSEPG